MLDNGHKAVGSDGCADLNPNGILRSAPELFDLKMLFEPLEEQLYLPSVLVQVGNLQGRKVERIGQEDELTPFFLIVELDLPEFLVKNDNENYYEISIPMLIDVDDKSM